MRNITLQLAVIITTNIFAVCQARTIAREGGRGSQKQKSSVIAKCDNEGQHKFPFWKIFTQNEIWLDGRLKLLIVCPISSLMIKKLLSHPVESIQI